MSEVTYGLRWQREKTGDGPSTLRSTRYWLEKTVDGGKPEILTTGHGHSKMMAIHGQIVAIADGGGPDAEAAAAALDEDWQEVA